jgi:hypothetical protein
MKNFSDYLEVIQESKSSTKGETAKPEAPSYFIKENKKAVEVELDNLIKILKESLEKEEAFNIIVKQDKIEEFEEELTKNQLWGSINLSNYKKKKINKSGGGSKSYRQITGLDEYKAAAYVELNFNLGGTDRSWKDKGFYNIRQKVS